MSNRVSYTEQFAKEWFDSSGIPIENYWVEICNGQECLSYKLQDGKQFDLIVEISELNQALCKYIKKHGKVINLDE